MIPGFIGSEIRRTTRNLLIINVALVAVAVFVLVVASGYIHECFAGPFPITVEEITKLGIASKAPHKFVKVQINVNRLQGLWYHISGGQEHKNDYYHFLQVSDTPRRLLVIKSGSQQVSGELEGTITSLGSDFESKVWPAMSGRLSGTPEDVMLDASGYRGGLVAMGVFCGLAFVVGGWNIAKALGRMGDPRKHPVAKRLAKFGPPEEIAVGVNAEVAATSQKTGKVLTTTSWLLRPRTWGLDLVYLGDVVWTHKKETRHKTYGVTTSTTYSMLVYDVTGRVLQLPMSQVQVDQLLRDLAQRVPWAIVGWNAAIASTWKKNRAQFLATVEARKKQVTEAVAKGSVAEQ